MKEELEKGLQRCELHLHDAEVSIDYARDEIQDLINIAQVSDEVYDFIISLMDNSDVPKEVQDKAKELWLKL